jgi:hypothetical protein
MNLLGRRSSEIFACYIVLGRYSAVEELLQDPQSIRTRFDNFLADRHQDCRERLACERGRRRLQS